MIDTETRPLDCSLVRYGVVPVPTTSFQFKRPLGVPEGSTTTKRALLFPYEAKAVPGNSLPNRQIDRRYRLKQPPRGVKPAVIVLSAGLCLPTSTTQGVNVQPVGSSSNYRAIHRGRNYRGPLEMYRVMLARLTTQGTEERALKPSLFTGKDVGCLQLGDRVEVEVLPVSLNLKRVVLRSNLLLNPMKKPRVPTDLMPFHLIAKRLSKEGIKLTPEELQKQGVSWQDANKYVLWEHQNIGRWGDIRQAQGSKRKRVALRFGYNSAKG